MFICDNYLFRPIDYNITLYMSKILQCQNEPLNERIRN